MPSSLNKLVSLRDSLEARIAELQQKNRSQIVEAVREVIAEYDISELELAGRKRAERRDKGTPRGPLKKRPAKTAKAAKAGKRRRARRVFSDAQKAKIVEQASALREAGASWKAIGQKVDVDKAVVMRWLGLAKKPSAKSANSAKKKAGKPGRKPRAAPAPAEQKAA
jgi:transposase-like protein